MRTISQDEKDLRAALVNVEIEIEGRERYPLRRDLGWSRMELTRLRLMAARLRQQIAVTQVLTESETP